MFCSTSASQERDVQEQTARDASGPREPPAAPPSIDRSFDIAASLDAIENLDATGGMASASFAEADSQVDVEQVFAAFKEGVAKQVSVDDAQSHYDLGVAYKEMGLLEDAIREFEIAARDEQRECVCRSMVGMIQMERGKITEAIEAFQKGLAATIRTSEQEMVLCYDIGAGYETMNRTKEALSYFQRVAKLQLDVPGRRRSHPSVDRAGRLEARGRGRGSRRGGVGGRSGPSVRRHARGRVEQETLRQLRPARRAPVRPASCAPAVIRAPRPCVRRTESPGRHAGWPGPGARAR